MKHVILIDFDATCVMHQFPEVGLDIGAAPVLRELVSAGHQLILWTIRSDRDLSPMYLKDPNAITEPPKTYLGDAVKWFKDRDIPLYGINENPTQKSWTSSKKAYGTLCIDDINLGAQLFFLPGHKPFVDWIKTYEILCEKGILEYKQSVFQMSLYERMEMIKSLL